MLADKMVTVFTVVVIGVGKDSKHKTLQSKSSNILCISAMLTQGGHGVIIRRASAALG
jgi:hypothetical protein